MRSFWSDPYLWVHLAGLAAVPLLAEVCLVGLAVGDPWLPVGLELLLVGAVGIAPVLWMQWQRPFCIFSLTPVALRPDALSDDRRRLLRLFKGTEVQVLAGSVAIALFIFLWQLFRFAPVATEAAAGLPQNRALGLLIAAIAFLLCNLFVQVPLSVVRALLSNDAAIARFAPYTPVEVAQSFTIPGFRVKQIVPDLLPTVPRPQPSGKRDRSQPVSAEPLLVDDALNQSPWDNKIELPDSAPQQEPPPASLSDLSIEVNLAEASAAEQTTVAAGVEAIAEDIRSEDIRSEDTNQGLDAIAAEGLGVASERLEGDDNAWNVFSLEEAELSLSEAAPPDSEDVEALVTEALEAVAAEWSDADLPGLPDLPDAELSPERLESATELPVEAEPPVEAESVANGDRLSEATDPGHSEKPSGESSNSTETEMSDQPPIEEQ